VEHFYLIYKVVSSVRVFDAFRSRCAPLMSCHERLWINGKSSMSISKLHQASHANVQIRLLSRLPTCTRLPFIMRT